MSATMIKEVLLVHWGKTYLFIIFINLSNPEFFISTKQNEFLELQYLPSLVSTKEWLCTCYYNANRFASNIIEKISAWDICARKRTYLGGVRRRGSHPAQTPASRKLTRKIRNQLWAASDRARHG